MSIEIKKAIVRRFFDEFWNERRFETLGEYVFPERLHHCGTKVEAHGLEQMRSITGFGAVRLAISNVMSID
jgi:hypothetical protein